MYIFSLIKIAQHGLEVWLTRYIMKPEGDDKKIQK